jgi:hypothetical protein
LLCGCLKGTEGLSPEAFEVGAELSDPSRVDAVDPAIGLGSVDHQARALQHQEVLGYRRATDGKVTGDVPDGHRPSGEALENRTPGRIAKHGQWL